MGRVDMKRPNDNMQRLPDLRGAVPIQSVDKATQDAVNQQVAKIFTEARLFESLYRHWVVYAKANGWDIGSSPDLVLWAARHQSGTLSPEFNTIGGLFDWLAAEIEAKHNGTSTYQYD